MTLGNSRSRRVAFAVVAATAAAGIGASVASASGNIDIVAYAVPGPAVDKVKATFVTTPAGKGTSFSTSFGASGDQSRAVASGQPADWVNFSVEPDITRLVTAGLVSPDWKTAVKGYKGVPATTLVVFGVRPGNPKKIKTWADLIKPGVQIVTPDYKSSGSAKWNDLAAFGQAKQASGGSDAAGLAYLTALYKNVVAYPKSGREATETFVSGQGDVVLTYESEAIAAKKEGKAEAYVIPPNTIQIQPPAAVIERSGNLKTAQAFNQYQYSTTGQIGWGLAGYRPVDPRVLNRFKNKLPKPAKQFSINYFGGWTQADADFFASNGWAVQARNAAR